MAIIYGSSPTTLTRCKFVHNKGDNSAAGCTVTITQPAATALSDYDGPTNAEMVARTIVSASYGTAANQTTIIGRIGAFTGTGVNTLLGFFRALFRKDLSAPTDVGGSFDPATDSNEAIADNQVNDATLANQQTIINTTDEIKTIVQSSPNK